MGPKAKRGRGAAAKKTTKRGAKASSDDDEPSAKIQREDSFNTQLKKAITEVKESSSKKKKIFKVDQYAGTLSASVHENFSCMLNQTNIGHNNNKFYVIQLLKSGSGKKIVYDVFTRWGRVGEIGQQSSTTSSKSEDAIKGFEKKFKDKTKNDWAKRDNFTPSPGKYTMLEIDEESDDEDETDNSMVLSKTDASLMNTNVKCSLDARTILLIRLIFNDDMFIGQMALMNLDVRKMPLGKLSKTQIGKGLEVLIDIEECIKGSKKQKQASLSELSSKFYTLVPHDFGRTVPPIINTEAVVNQKKELMMTLSDIELTQSLQKQKSDAELSIHPLDEKYGKLDCNLELLSKNSIEFKMITTYATACPTTRQGPILDIWRMDRKDEQKRFDLHSSFANRKLLWHGTNVAVVAAIMKAGLRIMPHSGGRVGKGIYFASEHQKSSWYVGIHYGDFEKESNIGFMFLVEVALGNEKHIKIDNGSLKAAPQGYDSVVARGNTEPDPKKDTSLKLGGNDVVVPLGKPINQKEFKDSNFCQSEYLVYKESQARIRYLLKFSFK